MEDVVSCRCSIHDLEADINDPNVGCLAAHPAQNDVRADSSDRLSIDPDCRKRGTGGLRELEIAEPYTNRTA